MKTIDLIQHKTGIPFTAVISSIREFYFQPYKSGGGNIVITFLDGTSKYVVQSVNEIKSLLND